ncbi:uncharacterized protein LOC123502386 isoform X1 [Portunus trituberculatus]|uniref:uncharacterized protein LOC123502386 isoform X1 n=1 Tax=Portunus trituberculatus TaxID=210409 RepID=UPI001E1CFD6A|nr:uncharacterized protein LOC123502386 isoform X1 [Portunus trituberculatus]
MVKGQDATSHGRRWEENEGEGCNWSESVIRSRDCSDPMRPAPSGKDSLASHCAYIDRCRRRCYRYSEGHCLALGLHCRPADTRVAVAATGTEGLRLAAAWQTPATPPPLTPPPQSRDSASHSRHPPIQRLLPLPPHYGGVTVLGSVVTTE